MKELVSCMQLHLFHWIIQKYDFFHFSSGRVGGKLNLNYFQTFELEESIVAIAITQSATGVRATFPILSVCVHPIHIVYPLDFRCCFCTFSLYWTSKFNVYAVFKSTITIFTCMVHVRYAGAYERKCVCFIFYIYLLFSALDYWT